jgi:hypothetical protein
LGSIRVGSKGNDHKGKRLEWRLKHGCPGIDGQG